MSGKWEYSMIKSMCVLVGAPLCYNLPNLQAGQWNTHTLCIRSHAAGWGLTWSCWNGHWFQEKDGSTHFSKILRFSSTSKVVHTNASHPWCGRWCTLSWQLSRWTFSFLVLSLFISPENMFCCLSVCLLHCTLRFHCIFYSMYCRW